MKKRKKRGAGKLPSPDKINGNRRFGQEAERLIVDSVMSGGNVPQLAESLGVNRRTIYKILVRQCGPDWRAQSQASAQSAAKAILKITASSA